MRSTGRAHGWRGVRFAILSDALPENQHGRRWELARRQCADAGYFTAVDLSPAAKKGEAAATRAAIMEWIAGGHVVVTAVVDRTKNLNEDRRIKT